MKVLISIVATVAALFVAFSQTDPGKSAELNFIRPLEFLVRDQLGFAPLLNDSVKILAFDDLALHRSGSSELSPDEWPALLQAVLRRGVKGILIDKIFALPPETGISDGLTISGPVFAGANTSGSKIPYRTELDLQQPLYQWQSYFKAQEDIVRWPGQPAAWAYGPATAFRPMFRGAGHINYDLYGRIRPLAKVGADRVLPHLSLLAAERVQVEDGTLLVNGSPAPVNSSGLLQVNFPPKRAMYAKVLSLAPFVQSARKGAEKIFNENINEGDFVLILPLFYTGNTDFKETPVGTIPGGLVHAAMVNSIVSGAWLREVPGKAFLIILLTALGACFGYLMRPVLYFTVITGMTLLVTGAGLVLFSLKGLILPWSYPVLAMLFAGTLAFIYRSWQKDRLVTSLQSAFQGLVPDEVLREYIASPDKILSQTEEVTATIMFIDIVGFSAFSSKETPAAVFKQLKYYIGLCTKIIHEHEGIIDKTLGDGLLAFFGYDYSGKEKTQNHADSAIRAALSIQRTVMKEYGKLDAGQLVLPLRIGINTARVYLGNLGSPPRIDFTVIGDGVNFAQRLESACEPFHINISQSTLDNSTEWSETSPGMTTKLIEVKHYHEDFEVFELNPFSAQPDLLVKIKATYNENKGKIRRFVRHPVLHPERIGINIPTGPARLVDYSRPGISIETAQKLEDQKVISLTLEGDRTFEFALQAAGVSKLSAEVRWSRPSAGGYTSGLLLKGLDEDQLDQVFKALRTLLHVKSGHEQVSC